MNSIKSTTAKTTKTKRAAKKIFSFNVPEESIKELEIISKLYLNEKLEKEYKLEDLFKK